MGAGRRFVRRVRAASLRVAPALALLACRDEPTGATAPFLVEASLSAAPGIPVGTELAPAPTFVVRNAQGQVLANVAVAVKVSAGGGILRNAPVRTSAGPTTVGNWTLGTLAGVNEITIKAGSAPPVRITLTGIPGAAASISPSGAAFEAPAGEVVASAADLVVRDQYGNPVGGTEVALGVAEGGGSVSPSIVTSDANGRVSGFSWRLGRFGGAQKLVASTGSVSAEVFADIRSGFSPQVRFGGNLTEEVRAAFQVAADRIQASVVGDVADVPVLNFDMSRCGVQDATVSEVVDDILIFATVTPIDGAGKVLASAGPCVMRTQSRFPVIGVMRFDADDIAALSANGRLPAVVLHEMLHVVGIGTLWRTRDLVFGSQTSDPRFAGLLAASHCVAIGGAASCADGRVPLENTGGSGTAEVHWRESVFDREVMTGFVEQDADMPLSGMTLASLEDLGYAVNLFSADAYSLVAASMLSPRLSPSLLAPWESMNFPLFEVTPSGWVRRLP